MRSQKEACTVFNDLAISPDLPPKATGDLHPDHRYCGHCRSMIGYDTYLMHVPGCLALHQKELWDDNLVARPDWVYPEPRRIVNNRRKLRLQFELMLEETCPQCGIYRMDHDVVAATYWCELCGKLFPEKKLYKLLESRSN
jgi:hypothetical protein